MAIVRQAVSVSATLLVLAALTGPASAMDFDRAWQSYLDEQTTIEPAYRFPHGSCFAAASAAYNLPRTLLLAVARGESDFEVTARSRANAHGVMQILWPTTAQHLGIYRLSQLYDPCTNIDAGARYLRELLESYDGNLHLALAAYNYGPQRIAKDGREIPRGANWYSGYIYRHLQYVLGSGTRQRPVNDALYSEFGQSTLVTFGEPYRAEAFVARLEAAAPSLSLDWFRRGTGEFEVVMTYADREEFDRAAARLAEAGFRLAP